jgi:hypothetical protein
MRIYGLMLKAQSQVNKILTRGKFSENAIEDAVDVLEGYTAKINEYVERIKDSWARKWVKEDNVDAKVYVETYATAEGEETFASSDVKIAMIDTAGGATLTIGTATSIAIAEGGEEYVSASTFSKAEGVDVGKIVTYTSKGPNYEKATEAIILIDWDSIYDKNWVWKKHHNVHNRAKKYVDDSNVAIAKADVAVVSEDGATAITEVSSLAIDETISETYAAGYAAA